jgi:hypothetical protein
MGDYLSCNVVEVFRGYRERSLRIIKGALVGGSIMLTNINRKANLCDTARMNGDVSSNEMQLLNSRLENAIPNVRLMVDSVIFGYGGSFWAHGL